MCFQVFLCIQKYLLNIYYSLDTVLYFQDIALNTVCQKICSHGPYILPGMTNNKKVGNIYQKVINSLNKNEAKEEKYKRVDPQWGRECADIDKEFSRK